MQSHLYCVNSKDRRMTKWQVMTKSAVTGAVYFYCLYNCNSGAAMCGVGSWRGCDPAFTRILTLYIVTSIYGRTLEQCALQARFKGRHACKGPLEWAYAPSPSTMYRHICHVLRYVGKDSRRVFKPLLEKRRRSNCFKSVYIWKKLFDLGIRKASTKLKAYKK